jgi:hypothetical protein
LSSPNHPIYFVWAVIKVAGKVAQRQAHAMWIRALPENLKPKVRYPMSAKMTSQTTSLQHLFVLIVLSSAFHIRGLLKHEDGEDLFQLCRRTVQRCWRERVHQVSLRDVQCVRLVQLLLDRHLCALPGHGQLLPCLDYDSGNLEFLLWQPRVSSFKDQYIFMAQFNDSFFLHEFVFAIPLSRCGKGCKTAITCTLTACPAGKFNVGKSVFTTLFSILSFLEVVPSYLFLLGSTSFKETSG